MNDSMSSLPRDDREQIARVSPELALVDPELAHRLRRVPGLARRVQPPLPTLHVVPAPSHNGRAPDVSVPAPGH